MHIFKSKNRDRGASLIEFAMIMPLLIILLLSIIEFGYFMGELNELKHGAHEGARLAAVNDAALLANTCASMDLNSSVTVAFTNGAGNIGDQGSVIVSTPVISLSGLGLIEMFLPASMAVDANFRLEQKSGNWSSASGGTCP